MTKFRIFDVGGFIRDELLGKHSKDRDCTVVIEGAGDDLSVEDGFALMRDHLVAEGFTIFVEQPEHGTIRANPPAKGDLPADFVLAREDGPYSDGRRPDWVKIGTLASDLDRRDFTLNALAREVGTDVIIDRHNGLADLEAGVLRFVGDPADRIREDALRVMRAVRFSVTKGFTFAPETTEALADPAVPELLAAISEERRAGELRQMFAHAGTSVVLDVLSGLPTDLRDAMFAGRCRLATEFSVDEIKSVADALADLPEGLRDAVIGKMVGLTSSLKK
jgi:tRNA nucleotidyltransferase/poly(A) polymerase